MRKQVLWILPIILILLSGCINQAGEIKAALGEKFTLAIGQSAAITGENLEIRFVEVIGDSRCPQGVQCIWAGEASSHIEITYADSKYQLVLTQPSDSEAEFASYLIRFNLTPYPVAGKQIQDRDYRLELQIEKKTS